MKRALLLILCLLSGCAHPLHPAVFPSASLQCIPMRGVACVGMEHEVCEEYVERAVHQLNKMAGRPILHYIGEYEAASGQGLFDSGVYVVGYGKLPKGTLGVTYTSVNTTNGCIENVMTALDKTYTRACTVDYHIVLLHELIHGLGFDHAPGSSVFGSIMEPAYHEGGPTPLDADTIRGVYGR